MEHNLSGKDYVLMLDTSGVAPYTAYDTVVCLRDHKFQSDNNDIDASSQCGSVILPGIPKEVIDFGGIQEFDPGAGRVSGANLYQTKQDRRIVGFQITPAAPITGDPVKTGTGYISTISEDYSFNTACMFTAKINIIGVATQTITV